MNELSIVCLPDLLRGVRSFPEAFFDLVREPVRQGCNLDIGLPPAFRQSSLLPGFDLTQFRSLAYVETDSDLHSEQWTASYYKISDNAVDYLFAHLPRNCLILSFEIPPWLVSACKERDIPFIDMRPSPLRFGRDLYIALRSSDEKLFQRISQYNIMEEEIRLEASLLAANIRMHQIRMEDERGYQFENLQDCLIFIGQAPFDASLLAPDGRSVRCADYSLRLQQLAKGRRLLHKAHPFALDFAEQERIALERITDQSVTPCQLSAYQILSSRDDVELVGLSSGMLQEASYFNKPSHVLFQPFVPIASEASESSDFYQQIHFHTFFSPGFWHQVLTPDRPEPRLKALPALAHNHAREVLDHWWDYSKVMTWERAFSYESFMRSGGASIKRRIEMLEQASGITNSL